MTGKAATAPRGMRDLLPAAARRQQYVTDTLREVFESFGYEPLVTPAVENAPTLIGKYGPDAERLIYRAGLQGRDNLALRYDFSVPLARLMAENQDLPRPFRRYQVGPVWRGERPQRGRYREFVQADVDIVGSDEMLADAEIIAITIRALERLGFSDTLTKVNNRKLLNGIGRYSGVPASVLPGLYRAIDKYDKVGLEGLRLELRSVGLPADLLNRQRQAVGRWMRGQADRSRLEADMAAALEEDASAALAGAALPAFFDALTSLSSDGADDEAVAAARMAVMKASVDALRSAYPAEDQIPEPVIDELLDLLSASGSSPELLSDLERRLDDAEASEGMRELEQVFFALEAAGVPSSKLELDFRTVRGLEYYTGTIFETVVSKPPIGSITGGGRYDELIATFGVPLPAVGTSFGVDRLVDVLDEQGMFPDWLDAPVPEVLVTRFDETTTAAAIELAAQLRSAGIRAESYLSLDRLGEQIRTAVRRGIPAVAILGPDELAAGTVTIKDIARETQVTVPLEEAPTAARRALSTHSKSE